MGRFHKQFQESKVILDDYIHTLKKSEKDKKVLMNLLSGGEAFYEVAQDEAKVIVNVSDFVAFFTPFLTTPFLAP